MNVGHSNESSSGEQVEASQREGAEMRAVGRGESSNRRHDLTHKGKEPSVEEIMPPLGLELPFPRRVTDIGGGNWNEMGLSGRGVVPADGSGLDRISQAPWGGYFFKG
ncbi:uncharacterized protein A4U43_C02F6940 [Asparagus officinalis]|uniref:Uncharacterized protein n=1 Tax=Asparagus officinalis TaxID=4686 RepID=A0A5P1FJA6_ASPOF|nr:uncharacterized protein A4U43_C02F6940 [Asparagus officinalis]